MKLAALLLLFFFGKGWTGTLVDSDCKDAHKEQACGITRATTHYGVVRDGATHHYFRFGDEANVRVAAALAERQKKTGKFPEGSLKVWFTGKPEGNRLALNDFALR